MRTSGIVILLLLASPPAFALSREDTMAAWTRASSADQASVLDDLYAGRLDAAAPSRADMLGCLQEAGKAEGHAALSIRQVAQACAAMLAHPALDEGQSGI